MQLIFIKKRRFLFLRKKLREKLESVLARVLKTKEKLKKNLPERRKSTKIKKRKLLGSSSSLGKVSKNQRSNNLEGLGEQYHSFLRKKIYFGFVVFFLFLSHLYLYIRCYMHYICIDDGGRGLLVPPELAVYCR